MKIFFIRILVNIFFTFFFFPIRCLLWHKICTWNYCENQRQQQKSKSNQYSTYFNDGVGGLEYKNKFTMVIKAEAHLWASHEASHIQHFSFIGHKKCFDFPFKIRVFCYNIEGNYRIPSILNQNTWCGFPFEEFYFCVHKLCKWISWKQ